MSTTSSKTVINPTVKYRKDRIALKESGVKRNGNAKTIVVFDAENRKKVRFVKKQVREKMNISVKQEEIVNAVLYALSPQDIVKMLFKYNKEAVTQEYLQALEEAEYDMDKANELLESALDDEF